MRGWPTARLVVAVTGVAIAARAGMSLIRSGPVLMADEAGYLGNARTLAGGIEIVMGSSPFYRSGYSLLLVPLLRLDLDPELTYRLVLLVNAVLAASLVPLLYLLLTRCFGVADRLALGAAVAGAAYPSVTTLSQLALSENALFPLFVLWLLAIGTLVRADHRRLAIRATGAGSSAAALWLVHGRMIVVAAVTAVVLVVLVVRRRLGLGAAGAGIVALAAGFALGRLVDGFIVERSYDGRRTDQVANALAPLESIDGLLTALRNVLGQSWYLVVASFGLVVVVLVVEVPSQLRHIRGGTVDPATVVLGSLVTATGGLLVVSALWFDAASRPDQLVYGRYVEPVLPAMIAVGVAALARRTIAITSRLVLLGTIVALSGVVAIIRASVDFAEGANRWNVASLPFVTGTVGPAIIAGAGFVGIAGAAALLGTATVRSTRTWAVAAVLFVPTAAFSEATLVRRAETSTYPASWTLPRALIEARGGSISYDTSRFHNVAVKVYQWHLPDTRFVLFDGDELPPPTELFFSSRSWDVDHPEAPATQLWDDPVRDQALWDAG